MGSARKHDTTARKIVSQTGLRVSARTVQKVLQQYPQMGSQKAKPRYCSAKRGVCLRFEWFDEILTKPARFWRRTLFTHEKRFDLDGTDGMAYYWCDKRFSPTIFYPSKNVLGGLWFSGILVPREDASKFCDRDK